MWNDLKLGVRGLARQPLIAITVLVSLALGIGASTAVFSVFDAVVLRELPFPNAAELYAVRTITPDGDALGNVAPRDVERLYDTPSSLRSFAISFYSEGRLTGPNGDPHNMGRYGVTDQFFEVLGVPMALGRGFRRGEPPGPVVLAHSTWATIFGSDPDVLGRVIQLENGPRTVVGVAPPGLDFPGRAGYWTLMALGPAYANNRIYQGWSRVQAETSEAEFEQELRAMSADLGPPPSWGAPIRFVLTPLDDAIVGTMRPTVVILLGAATVLMLIATLNVAQILLVRGETRMRDVGIRSALGARRSHLVRFALVEGVVLAATGGVLGVALAYAGVQTLLTVIPPDLPRIGTAVVDARVLWFAAGSSVAIALLVGLFPAMRLAATSLGTLMGKGAPMQGVRRTWLFNTFVVLEVSLAVLLVIGAGLLVRSFEQLTTADPGFTLEDPHVTVFINAPYAAVETRVEASGRRIGVPSFRPVANFYSSLLDRLARVPGIEGVGATSTLPLALEQWDRLSPYAVLGRPGPAEGENRPSALIRSVSPGFFETMRIRLLAGRPFTASDNRDAPSVAIVNEAFVRRFLGGANPIGRQVSRLNTTWAPGDPSTQYGEMFASDAEVVGLVSDVRYASLRQPPMPAVYLAHQQATLRRMTIVARSRTSDPTTLVAAIRREIAAIDPQLTVGVTMFQDVVRTSLGRERLGLTLMSLFGTIALVLAAVGVYGVMSYSVTQRFAEMGVRSALGATRGGISRLVLIRGAALAATGVAIGVAAAILLHRVIGSQLDGVSVLDARVLLVTPGILLGVALLSSLAPARRASRINPADLLRRER
jgi:putative ABC transport system permease protein